MSTSQETPLVSAPISNSAPRMEPSLSDTVSRPKIGNSSSKLAYLWQNVIPKLQGPTESTSAPSTPPVQARHASVQSHIVPQQGPSPTIYSTPAHNPMPTGPSTAERNLVPPNDARTGETTVTSVVPPEATLGPGTVQSQDPFREPLEIPGCKKKSYVYRHADALISDAHKERYHEIIDLFREKLLAVKALSKSGPANTLYKMKMCGQDPQNVKPSILVCHSWIDKNISRQIWKSLTEKSLRKQYECTAPVFGIHMFFSLKFWMLGSSMKSLSIYLDNSLIIGAPLVSNNTSHQVSTIACGVSFIDDNNIFALTSAHAFENNYSKKNDEFVSSHDDSTTESGSQESDETSDQCSSSTDDEYDWDELEVAIALERQEADLSDPKERVVLKDNEKEGLPGHSEIKPGRVWGRRNNPEWENLDWALIEIPSLDQRNLLSWPSEEGNFIEPSCPSKAAGAVIVATASGLLEGTLSSIPSYLASSGNSTTWTKIWTLSLADQDQRRLHKGDSGSAVLNVEKNRVYGYITALNPFGELHVMSLQAVLNQIKEMAQSHNPSFKPMIFDKVRATNSSNNDSTIRAERWPNREHLIQLWPEEPAEVPENESPEVTVSPPNDGGNQISKPLSMRQTATPTSQTVMDFRHLIEYFEGTIFADDYRTNLKVASERIAALEACVPTNDQEDDTSGLLLAQAVYFSICGDFVNSKSYLSRLSRIARSTNESSLLARCIAYEVYIRSAQNVPPFLRFRVDSDTGPAIVRGIGISALRVQFLRKRIERGTPELSSLEKFEANVLRTCTSFLNDLWLEALPEHPLYSKDLPIVLFHEERNYWDDIRQTGDDTNFPAIARYLDKLTLQYRLAGDAGNARTSLLSIYDDVLERGDLIAAANCQLQLGDAILSPPFTSPCALNLVTLVRNVGWANDMWDKKEHEFALKQDPEAMQCYKQAHFLFEASESERGMAAVLLRYACLDIADAILEPTQKDKNTEKDLVQLAYDHLKAAKELFEGDITNSLIVQGHLTICEILRENIPTALKLCFDIGDIGRRTGNTCTSEFVGMLYLRLARKLASYEARAQDAIMLCTCATVCFKGMADPYLGLHAAAASARFHQRRGDIHMALKHVKKGRKLLELTEKYFDGLEAQVESFRSSHGDQEQTWLDHDLRMLQAKRALCTTDFGRLASQVESSKQSMQKRYSTENVSLPIPNESSRPIRASPTTTMLQSSLFSGLDPSLMQSLIAASNSIDVLRQQYEDAIQRRRDELVIHADIDAAEKHLRDFLKKLETSSVFSEQQDTIKTAALHYLGDFERARETITRILPTSFGGTRVTLESEGANMQIKDIMATEKRRRFEKAVSLCFAAKDWKRGVSGVQDMLQRDPTMLDDMESSDDPHIWYTMVHIACILEQSGDIGRALEWYLSAFHVVEANRQQLADIKDHRDILSTISSGELFIGMARIAFQFSQEPHSCCGPSQQWTLTPAEWKDQGLRFLELGRSRTLLDLLIVHKLAPPDLEVWSKYSYQLRLKEKTSFTKDTTETKSQDRIDDDPEIREENLERTYGDLREELKSPSLSKLLPEPAAVRESNEKLYQCIPEAAIVLHITSSREGLVILCITSQGIIDIHTAELTDFQLDRHIFRFAKLFRDVKNSQSSSLPNIATCNQHLQAISDEIIAPVSQHIETKDHVIFIPSPSLNKFPLCALLYKKEPLFMSKDISQVPSLSVLQHLVDKKHHVSKKVSVIYKDPDTTPSPSLHISTSAAIKIAGSFHTKPQAATETFTEKKFTEMYQQSDVLFIATHGDMSTKSAWESHILLNPPFQVLNLAKLHSNANLVVFEACVSGSGEESIGNDLLGFSHAVLASGANAFLGGLWNVSEEASALLMLFLAEEIKTNKGSKSLARCWRNAQTRLYNLKVEDEIAIFEDLKNYLEAYQTKLIDKELAAKLGQTMEDVIKNRQESGANFTHPFYWAPFALIGHCGLVLDFN